MSNLIQFLKDNYQVIIGTILIYQIIITIFCFSTANLVILAFLIVIVAGYFVVVNFKDTFLDFFKK